MAVQSLKHDLTDTEIAKVKELAGLLFTPREIAVMLEKDVTKFITWCEHDTSIYTAFWSGRLQEEVDLRTNILKLAKSGSSPAQTMAMELLVNSKIKMIDR